MSKHEGGQEPEAHMDLGQTFEESRQADREIDRLWALIDRELAEAPDRAEVERKLARDGRLDELDRAYGKAREALRRLLDATRD